MKKENVPVYKINMTKMEIRQAVKILIEKAKSTYFKDSQIGVEIIEIDQFDQFVDEVNIRYHLQHLELKIKQTLLTFCEKIRWIPHRKMETAAIKYLVHERQLNGKLAACKVLFNNWPLRWMFLLQSVLVLVKRLHRQKSMPARRSVIQKKKESSGIVVIQEDGVMIESVGQEEQLAYTFRSNDKELLDKLNQANISVKNL
ncbi:hypothetical protein RCO48_37670 [Peribacillus frigoritolerans]|nr:hypothetical protein [Peribacillus frigoritolerans]